MEKVSFNLEQVMSEYKSKKATVSKAPYELYMAFVDMRNFVAMLPEDKRSEVTADYDSISAQVQGMTLGVRVKDRIPYSRIVLENDGGPLEFTLNVNFDPVSNDSSKTDFHLEVEADLPFMVKMMVGGKIKDGLDKVVDGLVAVSEGRMPEGVDPSMFKDGKMNF